MKKAIGGILALSALVLILGITSLLLLHWAATSKDQVFRQQVQDLLRAQELDAVSQRAASMYRSYLLSAEESQRVEIEQVRMRFRALLASIEQLNANHPEAQALLREIRQLSFDLEERSIRLVEDRERGAPLEQLASHVGAELLPRRRLLDATIARLISLEQAELEQAEEANVRAVDVAIDLTWAIVLGAVVLAAGLMWTLIRNERATRRAMVFERQLVGIVTHDLRSPLSALLLATRTLMQKEEARPLVKTLDRIERSARRMESVTHLMLDFTRARLGAGIPVVLVAVDLQVLCHEAVEEARTGAPERALQEEYSGDLRGQWDAARLAQVFANLLQNALKYSPPDTPVRLRASALEGSVQVEVHNQGTPIPRELLPRLFEPFRTGPQTEGTVRASLGLGLYIVRELVEAHGGTIAVQSETGMGTRFILTLPRTQRAGR
ncbi:MAG: ATP-binding protein [Hyalangium sp.]|uniref:sensor histidine kinase n=1 Tax=Hyalangium sp. TaxID=2028555 RepID=UPI00389A39D8